MGSVEFGGGSQPPSGSAEHFSFSADTLGPEPLVARYEYLSHLARLIASMSPDALSHKLRAIFQPVFKCDLANLVIFNRRAEGNCWNSFGADELARVDAAPDETTLWTAFREERPVWVPDWQSDERPNVQKEAAATGFVYRSLCRLPIRARQECIGVLSLATAEAHHYSDFEMRFLSMAADHVATGIENVLLHAKVERLKRESPDGEVSLPETSEPCFDEIVGQSPALQCVLRQVEMVAPTDCTVLIHGETGTGKELIAQAIHDRSVRSARPFLKVNCAAIPSGLLESELFGHEKGAFTGAVTRRAGRFELANKGTLFLDEVGDIPLDMQAKLLRVLQEREFELLGSAHTRRVDVRVIAATHRDLRAMIKEGTFRSDLYYRLHVFPLTVPPLRERREDIPLIVRHFVNKYAQQMNRQIEIVPTQAMEALKGYSWPGNIRELQNFIERAVILSPGSSLRVPLKELKQETVQKASASLGTLEEMEREHVLRALRESNWVTGGPGGAATKLGIKRTTLAYRIRRLKIPLRPV